MHRFTLLVLLAFSSILSAQTWTNILQPTYGVGAVDPFNISTPQRAGYHWENVGFLTQPGGAPPSIYNASANWGKYADFNISTQCTAGQDCASVLQPLLTACGNTNGYFNLSAGTITLSNVTVPGGCDLRGQGADKTIIQSVAANGTVAVALGCTPSVGSCQPTGVSTHWAYVTAGADDGSNNVLTVATAPNITVASVNAGTAYVILSELNLLPFEGYTGSEGSFGGAGCAYDSSSNYSPNFGYTRQRCSLFRVTACTNNGSTCTAGTLTLDRPIATSYKHNLPTWSATPDNKAYGYYDMIQANGHWYTQVYVQTGIKTAVTACPLTSGGCPITPLSMDGISDGTVLRIGSGSTAETIKVLSCDNGTSPVACTDPTATRFFANFNNAQGTGVTNINPPSYSATVQSNVSPSGGNCTITPNNLAVPNSNVFVGSVVQVGFGTTNYEQQTVTATTSTTFTIPCSFSHNAGENITNNSGFGCAPGSVSPTFPTTSGGKVADGVAGNNMCQWKEQGSDPYPNAGNNQTTQPKVVSITMQAIKAGVSNLRIIGTASSTVGGATTANIGIGLCVYCWVMGVESVNAYGNHVNTGWAFRPEIRDSLFDDAGWHQPGQTDGTVILNYVTTEGLVENNIGVRNHVGIAMTRAGANGNVIAYNYATGEYHYQPGISIGGFNSHTPGPQFNLYEGNVISQLNCDTVWGNNCFNPVSFRNWYQEVQLICAPINTGYQSTAPVAQCGTLQYPPYTNTISKVAVASNVLTITTGISHGYKVGSVVTFTAVSGTASSFLNNQTVTVASTPTSTTFTASLTTADYTQANNSGTITMTQGSFYTYQAAVGMLMAYLNQQSSTIGDLFGSTAAQTLAFTATQTQLPQGGLLQWANSAAAVKTYVQAYPIVCGYSEASDNGSYPLDNANACNTMFRHGWFDNNTGAITWAVGVTHTLPASFFRSSQPAYWSFPNSAVVPAWGASIGPDVTAGDTMGTLGNYHTYSKAANPAMNYYLNYLGGQAGGQGSPFSNFNIAAYYTQAPAPPFTITLTGLGLGNGTIVCTDNPGAGYTCPTPHINATITAGVCSGQCTQGANDGDSPEFTASPTSGNFYGWIGICSGNTNPCTAVIHDNGTLTARFDIAPTTTISCGNDCSINIGQPVTLSATSTGLTDAGASWTVTATDAITPGGYTAVYCTPTGCPNPPCTMSSCSGSPIVNPKPILPTTYTIVGISSTGVTSTPASVQVQVQPSGPYGYYNH